MAMLRARLRETRNQQPQRLTLLEYDHRVGCARMAEFRREMSSGLDCTEELCGELLIWPPRANRRRRAMTLEEQQRATRRAEEDIRRAQMQAEAALDAMEQAAQSAEEAAEEEPKGERR